MAITTDYGIAGYLPSEMPITKAFAITASDTDFLADANDKPRPTRYIMANGGGAVKLTFVGNTDAQAVTLTLAAGVLYKYAVKKVWSTGIAATGIHGFR